MYRLYINTFALDFYLNIYMLRFGSVRIRTNNFPRLRFTSLLQIELIQACKEGRVRNVNDAEPPPPVKWNIHSATPPPQHSLHSTPRPALTASQSSPYIPGPYVPAVYTPSPYVTAATVSTNVSHSAVPGPAQQEYRPI